VCVREGFSGGGGLVWYGLGWVGEQVIYVGWGAVVLFGKGGGCDCAGLVEEVMYCYFSVAIVFGASSFRLWIDGVI